MNANKSLQIEVDAVRALATWKSEFSDLVTAKAKELSISRDISGIVTLQHYTDAAVWAAQELANNLLAQSKADHDHKEAG